MTLGDVPQGHPCQVCWLPRHAWIRKLKHFCTCFWPANGGHNCSSAARRRFSLPLGYLALPVHSLGAARLSSPASWPKCKKRGLAVADLQHGCRMLTILTLLLPWLPGAMWHMHQLGFGSGKCCSGLSPCKCQSKASHSGSLPSLPGAAAAFFTSITCTWQRAFGCVTCGLLRVQMWEHLMQDLQGGVEGSLASDLRNMPKASESAQGKWPPAAFALD